MASRTRTAQSAHDKGVAAHAKKLRRGGWKVAADISGWSKPPTIAGRVPDIYATKPGSVRIVEVETDPKDDHAQHSAFRRHVGQKKNTRTFYGIIVDAAGRRLRYFD